MKRFVVMTVAVMGVSLLAACGSGGTPATDGSGSSSTSAPQTYTVGQAMQAADGRAVTVLSFKRAFSTGNEFEVPTTGKEFVQVAYALNNGSKREWMSPLYEISVIDANGQKFNATFVVGQSSVDAIVAGGKAASVTQVYEVPSGAVLDVAWTPNIFESTVLQTPLK